MQVNYIFSAARPLVAALALGTGIFAAPAHALLLTTGPVAFGGSALVTDVEGGTATTNSGAPLASASLQQFDASVGVLTGATVNLDSTRTASVQVTSSAASGGPNNGQVTSKGSGSSSAAISAPGLFSSFLPTIDLEASCRNNRRSSCTGQVVTESVTTVLSAAVADEQLNAYVGGGAVGTAFSAQTLEASQGEGAFQGTEQTVYSLNWDGEVGVTYSYLEHALASFDGSGNELALDFGTFHVGDLAMLGFGLNNAAGERVGLDLDAVSGSGDTDKLTTDLNPFMALVAGGSQSYTAWLDTSEAGVFSTTYLLELSDADVGASSSRFGYTMSLKLSGTVIDRPVAAASVPEPGSLALLGLGVIGLAALRRRA